MLVPVYLRNGCHYGQADRSSAEAGTPEKMFLAGTTYNDLDERFEHLLDR
jgi:hypothetical protein